VSWALSSLALLALAVAAGLAWYERERPPARVLALVAALAALAVVGRLAFAAVPNVKPTTDIVLFAGFALGAAPGFAVGAVTALASNVFLSQGPWTVWQMAGWGAVGIGGAVLARAMRGREPGRIALAAACGAAGLLFGAFMDVYQWTLAATQDLDTYLAIAATSLPYNAAHAIGNVAFALLIGPAFVRALRRYRRRFDVRWPAPATSAAAALLAVAAALGASAPDARASAAGRAERYLAGAQNRDGGFGASAGEPSGALFSGWAALGLASAGHNPRDVRRQGGRRLAAYVLRAGRSQRDVGEVERTVMVLRAAGLPPGRLGGRDLVAEIRSRRRADGSLAGYVSYTAFGVLALRAAGEGAGARTLAWLAGSQNADGGFGVARSSPSDADMTGAALQALAVAGRSRGRAARRAVRWLRSHQSRDGGFAQMAGGVSNAQSTSYAVQGLLAAGAARGAVERARAYLRRLQRPDGSVAYSRTSTQTPVWVTAQALLALRGARLPLGPVAREPAPERAPAADARAAPAPARERQARRHPARRAPARPRETAKAEGAARAPARPARPEGALRLRGGRDEGGGGPSAPLAGAALGVALVLLFAFRGRLRRLAGRARRPVS
jgi:energy-coupling factor transport system substrate-specific component